METTTTTITLNQQQVNQLVIALLGSAGKQEQIQFTVVDAPNTVGIFVEANIPISITKEGN